jgi:hypothetical protein
MMAKYEWMNLEKTLLKMKVSEDGKLWKEVGVTDSDYIAWAAQEENVADTPDYIQAGIDAEAAAAAASQE